MHLRSPSFPLLPPRLNDSYHLFPPTRSIDLFPAHAHADLVLRMCSQKFRDEEVLHQKTDVYSTIHAVVLLRAVLQVDEAERFAQQLRHFVSDESGLVVVGAVKRIVVEGDAIDAGHEQERPMGSALGHGRVLAVVDGEEDVCGFLEIGQSTLERERIMGLLQHEAHGGAQEDDVGFGVMGQLLALEVLLPEGDGVVGEPVVLDGVNVFAREADVVVAEVGIVWRKLSGATIVSLTLLPRKLLPLERGTHRLARQLSFRHARVVGGGQWYRVGEKGRSLKKIENGRSPNLRNVCSHGHLLPFSAKLQAHTNHCHTTSIAIPNGWKPEPEVRPDDDDGDGLCLVRGIVLAFCTAVAGDASQAHGWLSRRREEEEEEKSEAEAEAEEEEEARGAESEDGNEMKKWSPSTSFKVEFKVQSQVQGPRLPGSSASLSRSICNDHASRNMVADFPTSSSHLKLGITRVHFFLTLPYSFVPYPICVDASSQSWASFLT